MRRTQFWFVSGAVALSLGAAAFFATPSYGKKGGGGKGGSSEIQRGLEIAPVELNLTKKNKKLVALGSYLVNAQGGCNDCHTNPSYAPGGNPFQGQPEQINTAHYLAGGQQFGPFTSRNITPDENGLPAGMTLQQFIQTLRTGIRPGAQSRLQVMPWPVYGKMTDADLTAIYEYLRAIPHAELGVAE